MRETERGRVDKRVSRMVVGRDRERRVDHDRVRE
jgi:hypothetical protein